MSLSPGLKDLSGRVMEKSSELLSTYIHDDIDLKEQIEKIWKQIDDVSIIVAMSETPGWQTIYSGYIRIVKNIDRRIVTLSRDPKKNTVELIKLTATRDAIMTFISFVESSRSKYETALKNMEQKIQSLEEITAKVTGPF